MTDERPPETEKTLFLAEWAKGGGRGLPPVGGWVGGSMDPEALVMTEVVLVPGADIWSMVVIGPIGKTSDSKLAS